LRTVLPTTIRSQAFINGEFVDAASGETINSISPASGEVLATTPACDAEDIDRAVAAARAAFEDGRWSQQAPAVRKRVMLKFADLLESQQKDVALLDSVDAGKPIRDCEDLDLPDVVNTFRWYAEAIDKIFGKVSPTGRNNLGLIQNEPVGVVGAVLPWNFPAATVSWKLAPALAAGNSVIIKPAELAPLSTIRIAEIAAEAGIPDGVINVVPGLGHIAGKALGLHPDVDVLTFTGSTEVGRAFLRYSAESNLKKVVLELGGKSPQIVTANNADRLHAVAADLADAAFWNSGQNCTAGSRILVDNTLKAEFVDILTAIAASRVVGEPTDRSTEMGPLIDAAALERVLRYVEQAKQDGATIRSGGSAILPDTGGNYVGATVIDDVTPAMSVTRDEIFGPVVAVLGFDDDTEALRLANDTQYGLAANIWSTNIDEALWLARGIRAGTVAINGFSEGDITTPFGGYRMSGFGGRDKGLEAFDQYTESKTIWITLHEH
jgi:gamma-glutamyl-gamma-aminobutyraldehyde dehydrogenase